jgi:hypothetical protein
MRKPNPATKAILIVYILCVYVDGWKGLFIGDANGGTTHE